MTHDLKCWPGPFQATMDGRKTFEWRKDDRDYNEGDTLLLREWDPTPVLHCSATGYTKRTLAMRVTYVLRGRFDVPPGYVIMAIQFVPEGGA